MSSTMPPPPMAAQKRTHEQVEETPQKRAKTEQFHVGLEMQTGDIDPQRDTTMSLPSVEQLLNECYYSFEPSSPQPASDITHHQEPNASPYNHNDLFSSYGQPTWINQADPLASLCLPQQNTYQQNFVPAQRLQQQQSRFCQNVPSDAPLPPLPPLRAQSSRPIPPSHAPQYVHQSLYSQQIPQYTQPNRSNYEDDVHFLRPQSPTGHQRSTLEHLTQLSQEDPVGLDPQSSGGLARDGTVTQKDWTVAMDWPSQQYPPEATQEQQFSSQHPLPHTYSQAFPPATPPAMFSAAGLTVNPLLPPQPAAEMEILSWSSNDVTDGQRKLAKKYVNATASQLVQGASLKIPGIPTDHCFDFSPWRFAPDDIWLLRHLDPQNRHMEYLEFLRLCKKMQNLDPSKVEDFEHYFGAWFELRARTTALRKAEREVLSSFAEPPNETDEEKKVRIKRWTEFVNSCAVESGFDQTWSPYIEQPACTGKRSLEDDDSLIHPRPAKKIRQDGTNNTTNIQDGLTSPKVLKTKVRDQVLGHKKGEWLSQKARLEPEHVEFDMGVGSRLEWGSHHDATSTMTQRNEALAQNSKENKGVFLDEKHAKLPYWKRSYKEDLTKVPDHPFPNIEDYTIQENDRYRCFHKAYDCTNGTCTYKNHKCCRQGFDEAGLQKAIKKGIRTYKSQVERKIEDKKLDPRHKWWQETVNSAIKNNAKRAKKVEGMTDQESTKNAAQSGGDSQTSPPSGVSTLAAQNAAAANLPQPPEVPFSAAQGRMKAQEAQQKLSQEKETRKLDLERWQEAQEKSLKQHHAAKLEKLTKQQNAARKSFIRIPNNVGMGYFEQWWAAVLCEELATRPLTDKEKEWRGRPVPDYAKPKDVPSYLKVSENEPKVEQNTPLEVGTCLMPEVCESAPSAEQQATHSLSAPGGESDDIDDLFFSEEDNNEL